MDQNPCPVCGSKITLKFSKDSDWCGPCAGVELAEQDALRYATQHAEVFDA